METADFIRKFAKKHIPYKPGDFPLHDKNLLAREGLIKDLTLLLSGKKESINLETYKSPCGPG